LLQLLRIALTFLIPREKPQEMNITMFVAILAILIIPILIPNIFAHTIDAVDEYRLEIGWMNEPVISRETNGIELFISPLTPCPDIEIPMKCAASQKFKNGIGGLEKEIKIQLVLKDNKIMLPLVADHNIPGKYYAFVNPTVSGFYQANLLGSIKGTILSISMHPPKVNERSYIEFPEPADLTVEQIIDGHTALIDEINSMKNDIKRIDKSHQMENLGYAGITLGIVGIVIASIAMKKSKK